MQEATRAQVGRPPGTIAHASWSCEKDDVGEGM